MIFKILGFAYCASWEFGVGTEVLIGDIIKLSGFWNTNPILLFVNAMICRFPELIKRAKI
jgi:hypothetical protein